MATITRLTASLVLLGAVPLAAQWGPLPIGSPPSPRSDALLAYDLIGNRTLMFGGNLSNEFWSFENSIWTQLTPAVLPPARRYAELSVDVFTGNIILHGGQGNTGGSTALEDTWLWNGFDWQDMAPAVSTGGLMWHGMTFDPQRQVTLTFGGRRVPGAQTSLLDETWEYSLANNTWTLIFPTVSPSPRIRAAMAYHPTLDQSILFGGDIGQNMASDETWIYNGVTWTQINMTGVKPPARYGAKMVQNLTRGIVVLHGGFDPVTFEILNDTWEHDGTNWREIDNVYGGIYPARRDFAMTHDIPRDRVIAFGGRLPNGSLRNDTWEYGAQWQPFGNGCAGSAGIPTFSGVALPRIGQTAVAEIGNVPPSIPFAFVAVGLSRTQWSQGTLPALLDAVGMPSCRTYTSADLIVVANATAGTATWQFDLPLQPELVGTPFYLQGITFDPGINALGLAVSNAATLVIGN